MTTTTERIKRIIQEFEAFNPKDIDKEILELQLDALVLQAQLEVRHREEK